ncbi:hypothetical protein EHS25_003261 [Saitozyma podzolica]|uniref:Uncharacterized protein n=1 Tax=Saitozyma podzolica TaxID=1890683 RepID=A0A427Y8A8_9TREE|nr:hypothetical protein EHS25_003261 [Saitozyma podzolica]
MNTAGSVAYGWGALIVAAGVSFYYAKKEIDARRRDQQLRGARPTEKLSWQEKVAKYEQPATAGQGGGMSQDMKQGLSSLATSRPGQTDKATMQSRPTGVDTTHNGTGSRTER